MPTSQDLPFTTSPVALLHHHWPDSPTSPFHQIPWHPSQWPAEMRIRDTHIDYYSITVRANSTIGFLRRNLSLCTRDLKELAYFSLARSVLEYAYQVCDPHVKKDVTRLEQVQRRAARFTMHDTSTYSSITKMLDDLGWEPLSTKLRDHRLSLMFQITHGLVAIPMDDILIPAKSHTRASIEHNNVYRQLRAKTKLYRQSYFPRTIVEWNILDDNIVTSQTIDC